jgi:hypothetical protein
MTIPARPGSGTLAQAVLSNVRSRRLIDPTHRAIVVLSAVAIATAGLVWGASGGGDRVVAFDRNWTGLACQAVTASTVFFFEDSPGAGAGNEAGMFMVPADQAQDENCLIGNTTGVDTDTVPILRVRAAVNDSAVLTVTARSVFSCTAGGVLGTVTISGTESDSGFRTETANLPANSVVRKVCIRLDDSPDTHARRIWALIDDIQFRNGTGTVIQSRESFSQAG